MGIKGGRKHLGTGETGRRGIRSDIRRDGRERRGNTSGKLAEFDDKIGVHA